MKKRTCSCSSKRVLVSLLHSGDGTCINEVVSVNFFNLLNFITYTTRVSAKAFDTLCIGIVEPHFRYCCSAWGFAGSSEVN